MVARQVLRNALIVDGSGTAAFPGALSIIGGRIESIGTVPSNAGDIDFDCGGRILMPGFIDVHSHADGLLFREDIQLALLRQGLTTVIGGQDGVSYAPGDGQYASEYFAAVNGEHPSYRGRTVAELLASYDHATRLNFAYTVPAGTVRFEVMGWESCPADAEQLRQMQELIAGGLADGAVGLSSGLDYVPGMFSGTQELTALCAPVALAQSIYVTHMRGGYEANSAKGLGEIAEICRRTGVRAHVSHFHADPDLVIRLMAQLSSQAVDVTFDAYPYVRGCTLLGMPLLPPWLAAKSVDEIIQDLANSDTRDTLRTSWFPEVEMNASLGPEWPSMITLSHIAAPDYNWAHGMTIAEASDRSGRDAIDFSLDVLLASRLEVNAVMAVRHHRSAEELGRILAHGAHMGGSDGIFVGAHPHPRAYGTFGRYLSEYVQNLGTYTWPSVAIHLSARAADRFQLGDRGRLIEGYMADLVLVRAEMVTDNSSYEFPLELTTGIDDVFVSGVQVLADGALTAHLPGLGLRRAQASTG